MSDAIRHALLKAWLDLVAARELSDDQLVDPGFVSDVLGELTTDLRSSLTHDERAPLDPTAPEAQFMRRLTTGEGHRLYTWDAETATGTVPMMVIAQSAAIVEKTVHH